MLYVGELREVSPCPRIVARSVSSFDFDFDFKGTAAYLI